VRGSVEGKTTNIESGTWYLTYICSFDLWPVRLSFLDPGIRIQIRIQTKLFKDKENFLKSKAVIYITIQYMPAKEFKLQVKPIG
jgi:hypothetical protein